MDWMIGELGPLQKDGRNPLVNNFKREGWTDEHIFLREFKQNVLDNRLPNNKNTPARITFETKTLNSPYGKDYFRKLLSTPKRHIEASEEKCEIDFENPKVLIITEEGTTGFTGDYSRSHTNSDWANFFFGAAKEAKSGGKNGRAGQGKIVYYMLSKARSIFLLTKRHDDQKVLFMGNSNFVRTHEIDGTHYDHCGYFSKCKDGQPLPSEDRNEISDVSEAFDVDINLLESGNIFIIPEPSSDLSDISIIQTAIQDFFYPILKGKLEIKVGNIEINSSNLIAAYKEYKDDFLPSSIEPPSFEFLEFVNSCISPENEVIEGSSPWNGQESGFENIFTEDQIQKMKSDFKESKRISVSLPICVTQKGKKSEFPKLKVFLESSENISSCEEAYVRTDLYISKEKRLKQIAPKHAFGLVIAEDEQRALANFLANAEEASHLSWNARESKVEENFVNVRETLRKVRRSLPELFKFLIEKDGKKDETFMIGLLSIPTELDKVIKKPSKKKNENKNEVDVVNNPEPVDEIISKEKTLELIDSSSGDGFILKTIKPIENSLLPLIVKLKVAYDNLETSGDPFKNYEHLDFDFSEPKWKQMGGSGFEVFERDLNEIHIEIKEDTFEFELEGFNKNIPLKVKYNIKEFSSEK